MRTKQLTAALVVSGAAIASTALAGLPWAQAKTHTAKIPNVQCFKPFGGVSDYSDDAAVCLGWGPRGKRGPKGVRGHAGAVGKTGATGPVGFTGSTGPRGFTGATGATGRQGITGITGIVGKPGTFDTAGAYPGYHTIMIVGSKIGPVPSASGSLTGVELTPSVARCPTGGPDTEAYDGGVNISLSGANKSTDVVTPESSFPGIFVSQTEVDPLPEGSTPGAISNESANAYEAQAIVTNLNNGDSVTVQSYVVCGP
jgi:hypothetical protein